MKQSVAKLAEQAETLTPDERMQLVETILEHLPVPDLEWTAAWIREIEKRMASVERGETEPVPAEDVHARLREKYLTPYSGHDADPAKAAVAEMRKLRDSLARKGVRLKDILKRGESIRDLTHERHRF